LHISTIQSFLAALEPLMCIVALLLILRSRQVGSYKYLTALLATRLGSNAVLIPLLHPKWFDLSPILAYDLYFWIYWTTYGLEALLSFAVIISIFRLAMAPLPGLQSLGMLMGRRNLQRDRPHHCLRPSCHLAQLYYPSNRPVSTN